MMRFSLGCLVISLMAGLLPIAMPEVLPKENVVAPAAESAVVIGHETFQRRPSERAPHGATAPTAGASARGTAALLVGSRR
jgi:hypothetical protein